jgi:hypothetical protein
VTNEADGVMVHMGAEKGHGAGSTKRASTDVGGGDAQGGAKVLKGKPECLSDAVAGDGFGGTIWGIVGAQWGLRCGIVSTKVSDPLGSGGNRATLTIATMTEANSLIALAIFLYIVRVGDKGSRLQKFQRDGCGIIPTGTNMKLNIFELEQSVVFGDRVFTGAHMEKESDEDDVCNSQVVGGRRCRSACMGMLNNLDGTRLNTGRGVVGFGICRK